MIDLLSLLGLDRALARWRGVAAEVAVAAEDRAELFAIEWHEEKQRLARMVVLGLAAAALSIVALIVLSIAVLLQFWDTGYRHVAGWCVAGFWLLCWGAVLFRLSRLAQGGRDAFALTRQELARDWSEIKERL